MRIIKILLLPIALVCFILSFTVGILGSIFQMGLRLLGGLFGIGFFATIINGLMWPTINWTLAISCAAIAKFLMIASGFVDGIHAWLVQFSGWVFSF